MTEPHPQPLERGRVVDPLLHHQLPLARSMRLRCSNATCNWSASRPLTWAAAAWLSRVAARAAYTWAALISAVPVSGLSRVQV